MDEARLRLRTDELDWRELEGEIVALDLRESEYFAINRTGTLLWRAVAAGASRTELVALLVEEFGLTETAAAADVDRFVTDLERRRLVVPAE
jgi:Coenzyme PQQ synthesis protein D (PqqD)